MFTQYRLKTSLLSFLIFGTFCLAWHAATRPEPPDPALADMDPEYLELIGASAKGETNPMPGPIEVAQKFWEHLKDPFYYEGANDRGIGSQLLYSLLRVAEGYLLAVLVAVPLGFLVGMSPLLYGALDPFIQILKPVSPLAWMPLALYTIKDSEPCSIFVIFICAIWPVLINTAFGVAAVSSDYLKLAKTLEARRFRTAFFVILPAAAPTIVTGMRISVGIAWLVIVAAEMLIGGTGIGYFVWNEWNNLDITNVIVAIVFIGLIGMALDRLLAALTKAVTYAE